MRKRRFRMKLAALISAYPPSSVAKEPGDRSQRRVVHGFVRPPAAIPPPPRRLCPYAAPSRSLNRSPAWRRESARHADSRADPTQPKIAIFDQARQSAHSTVDCQGTRNSIWLWLRCKFRRDEGAQWSLWRMRWTHLRIRKKFKGCQSDRLDHRIMRRHPSVSPRARAAHTSSHRAASARKPGSPRSTGHTPRHAPSRAECNS